MNDWEWLRQVAMPAFGVKKIRIAMSQLALTHPDCWIELSAPPKITVTKEWMRQDARERRKRLTHELLHGAGLKHGVYNGFEFSTYPEEDTYSVAAYKWLQRGMRRQ